MSTLLRLAALVAVLAIGAPLLSPATAAALDPADLWVQGADVAPSPSVSGQEIAYDVTLVNVPLNAPGDAATATSVTLTAGLPVTAAVVGTPTASGGGSCTASPAQCSWGALAPDASVTMHLVIVVDTPVDVALQIPFTATQAAPEPTPEDNILETSTPVQAPGATDLVLTGSRTPATVVRGEDVTYDLLVRNDLLDSEHATQGVVLALVGPTGGAVTATWGDAAQACTVTGTDASCAIGPLVQGGVVPVHVVIDTMGIVEDPDGTFPAAFTVSHAETETDLSDDVYAPRTTIAGSPTTEPLVLGASVAPAVVGAGDAVTYHVTVHNPNIDAATASTVRLLLPPGVEPVAGSASPAATITGRVVTWSGVVVAATQTATLSVAATAGVGGALPFPSSADGVAAGALQPDVLEDAAPLTIRPLPVLSVGDVQVAEGVDALVPVDLANPWIHDVTVRLATVPGTALETDFTPRTGVNATVMIPAGATHGSFRVTTIEDALDEANEALTVVASSPTSPATLSDATGAITILDDDAPARVAVGDTRVDEGASGVVAVHVEVRLLEPSGRPVRVVLKTRDGSARAGSDYIAVTPTAVEFAVGGPLTRTLRVDVKGDAAIEPDETFDVIVLTAENATPADDTGRVTIDDDDVAPPPPARKPLRVTASASPVAVPRRGRVTYTVRLRNRNADVIRLTRLRACLPAGFTFIRGSTRGAIRNAPTRGTCGRGRVALTWRRALLVRGGKVATFRFRARAGRRAGVFATSFTGRAAAPSTVRPSGPVAPVRVRAAGR